MSKFFYRGKGSLKFVPTLTDYTAPTATQVNSGTDLGKAVVNISGFVTKLNRVNTPVLDYDVEVQIDGPQTFQDSSLQLLEDDGVTDADSAAIAAAQAALVDEATGYFVFCRTAKGTLTAGDKVYVFPARIGSNNPSWTLAAEPARSEIDVVLTAAPVKNVALA